jgi:hypothetical protein
MRELDLARQLHSELDIEYGKRLFRATARNHQRAIAKYKEIRRINDGAYFLIIFGTFERYVTDKADVAVKARTSKPLYKTRRAWETLVDGTKLRATFLNRVRVLLDQTSPIFQSIPDYYKVRNDLAHEGATTKIFSIPIVVNELKAAVTSMKS